MSYLEETLPCVSEVHVPNHLNGVLVPWSDIVILCISLGFISQQVEWETTRVDVGCCHFDARFDTFKYDNFAFTTTDSLAEK